MCVCSCVVVSDRNQQREIHRQINEQLERKCGVLLERVCHCFVGLWSLFICFSRWLIKCVCVCVSAFVCKSAVCMFLLGHAQGKGSVSV